MLLLMATITFALPKTATAQETLKKTYAYTDLEKNVTYLVFIKVSGYQVEIWYTSTTNGVQAAWAQAKVLYSDDNYIKYQIPYNNWQYELTMDPNNQDAIYIKNITTNGKKLRYFVKE